MNIFIPVVGQFTNVGDVMHRKELLSWVKDVGVLHIYVGSAPKSFVDSLTLSNSVFVYENLGKWLWAICKSEYRRTTFIFNPGEIRLGNRRLVGELFLLPFILLTKVKRGQVCRIGIAAVSGSSSPLNWLWRMIFSMSTKLYWRTNESRNMFRIGKTIPDLAFRQGQSEVKSNGTLQFLTISMRFDRPFLSRNSLSAIMSVAKEKELKILVVSQVRMDNERAISIAEQLGTNAVVWPEGLNHMEQEERLRKIYQESAIVVSDRLHVLIAAVTEGAIPVALLSAPTNKVQEHFSVIGVEDISMEVIDNSEEDILNFLKSSFNRKNEIREAVKRAREELDMVRKEIIQSL